MSGAEIALMLIVVLLLLPLLAWIVLSPAESIAGGLAGIAAGLAVAYFFGGEPLYLIAIAEVVIYLGLWFFDTDII